MLINYPLVRTSFCALFYSYSFIFISNQYKLLNHDVEQRYFLNSIVSNGTTLELDVKTFVKKLEQKLF